MKVYFVRHGFAYHNLGAELYGEKAYEMSEYKNSRLTTLGKIQATELGQKLANIRFDKIYCSPLVRCIDTCLKIPGNSQNTIILDDNLMEPQGKHICNKRDSKQEIIQYIESINRTFDISRVKDDYDFKVETEDDVLERINTVVEDLKFQIGKCQNVLVVTHHDWLYKFYNFYDKGPVQFKNCEYRIFEL